MSEHLGSGFGAYAWLHVLVVALVLPATLFALRHLVSDWHHLSDRLTPATHVGMGIAMSCMILAPWVHPDIIGTFMVVALGVAVGHRVLNRWALDNRASRHGLETPALAMMVVMAVMSFKAGRDSPAMTIAMLGCLLGCAAAYAVQMVKGSGRGAGPTAVELAAPLALTAGMVGMLAMP